MKPPLSYVPALPAAAGIAIGITAAHYGCAAIAFAGGVAVFAALYLWGRAYAGALGLFAAVGAALAWAQQPAALPTSLLGREATYYGSVVSASNSDWGISATIRLDSTAGADLGGALCRLGVSNREAPLDQGSRVRFAACLDTLPGPGIVPYANDYSRYLRLEGITCQGRVQSADLQVTRPPRGWQALVNQARASMYDAIVTSPFTPAASALLVAGILGDDDLLAPQTRQAFSATGLQHILALSGLHIGVLASLASLALWPLRFVRRGIAVRAFATAVLVWVYTIIIGMPPSAVRASVMLSVMLLSASLQRGYSAANSLCVAIALILAVSPLTLFKPGFQLSCAAVASILAFAGLVPDRLRRHPAAYYATMLAVVPMAAMLGTGLLGAFYFSTFPILFLVSNMVAGVLFPWILSIGMAVMLLRLCGIAAPVLCGAVNAMQWLLQTVADALARVPWGQVTGISFSPWAFVPYALGLTLLGVAAYRWRHGPSWRPGAGWLMLALAAFAATPLMAWATAEKAPRAEFFATGERPEAIMLRCDTTAYLIKLDPADSDQRLVEAYRRRYGTYLAARGVSSLKVLTDTLKAGPYYYDGGEWLVAGERSIRIVRGNPQARAPRALYAIAAPDCAADSLWQLADTVLMSSGLHPSRARKAQRECPDSASVVVRLRARPLSMAWR